MAEMAFAIFCRRKTKKRQCSISCSTVYMIRWILQFSLVGESRTEEK